jgi:hypothetical protein
MNRGGEMNFGSIFRFVAWAMGVGPNLSGGYAMNASTSTRTRSGGILVKGILKSFR